MTENNQLEKKEIKRENTNSPNNSFILNNDKNTVLSKNDLLYFKNDILKDIKNTFSKYNLKNDTKNFANKDELSVIEIRLKKLEEKVPNLIEENVVQSMINEKVSKLEENTKKFKEKFSNLEFELSNITKKFSDMHYKYEKIIKEEILNPRIIGQKNKFTNFKDFTDFLLAEVTRLGIEQEKEKGEAQIYKDKFDSKIQFMDNKFSTDINSMKEYTINCVNNRTMNLVNQFEDLNKEFNKNITNNINHFSNIEKNISDIFDKIQKYSDIFKQQQNFENKYLEHIKNYYVLTKDINKINITLDKINVKNNPNLEPKNVEINVVKDLKNKYLELSDDIKKFKISIIESLKKNIPNFKFNHLAPFLPLISDKQMLKIKHLAKNKFKYRNLVDSEKVPMLLKLNNGNHKSKSLQKTSKYEDLIDDISNIKLKQVELGLSKFPFDKKIKNFEIKKKNKDKEKEIKDLSSIDFSVNLPLSFIKKIDNDLKNHNVNFELNKTLTEKIYDYNLQTHSSSKKKINVSSNKFNKRKLLFPIKHLNIEEKNNELKLCNDEHESIIEKENKWYKINQKFHDNPSNNFSIVKNLTKQIN